MAEQLAIVGLGGATVLVRHLEICGGPHWFAHVLQWCGSQPTIEPAKKKGPLRYNAWPTEEQARAAAVRSL